MLKVICCISLQRTEVVIVILVRDKCLINNSLDEQFYP